jgi:hypothetical protein
MTKSPTVAVQPRILAILDAIIILIISGSAIATVPLLSAHKPATVVVFRDNTTVARYPLSLPTVFTVPGQNGPVKIAIQDNSVRITESNCPRGICMHVGAIHNKGQQIVCAPNHILVQLESSSETGVDGVTE